MKIAIVGSTALPPQEGLGNFVWNLAHQLQARGHTVEVFTRGVREETRKVGGLRIHSARVPNVPPLHVHAHAHFLQPLFDQHAADADIVHFHSPLPAPLRTEAPSVVTFHTVIDAQARAIRTWDVASILQKAMAPVSAVIERTLVRKAAAISAVSASVAGQLAAHGVDPSEVHVIGNGVDPERLRPRPALRERSIVCTGRLGPRKGHEDLLHAIALLKKDGFPLLTHITGKGPMGEQLKRLAQRLEVDDLVRFEGFVTRERLEELLSTSGAFVFPTHYEGLPTSVLEAMSMACPVVSTRAPGVIDLVEEGRTGILVPVGDSAALAAEVRRVLTDSALAQQLGAAGRVAVEKEFSWKAVTDRVERLYSAGLSHKIG